MPIAYCVSYMYIDACELPTPRRRPTQKKKKKKKAFPVYVIRAFQHARPPRTTTIRYILLISIILAAATATYKQQAIFGSIAVRFFTVHFFLHILHFIIISSQHLQLLLWTKGAGGQRYANVYTCINSVQKNTVCLLYIVWNMQTDRLYAVSCIQ